MRGFTLVHIFLGFLLYLTLCPRLHLPNKASALQALIQALLSRNLGNVFGTSIWKTDPQDRNIQLDCPLMEGIRAPTTGGK